jgi:hypothetical protein
MLQDLAHLEILKVHGFICKLCMQSGRINRSVTTG